MSTDARFRAWMFGSLGLIGLCFVYYLVADIHMPVSPEARLTYHVTQVAPDVSGRVVDVFVRNNQQVEKGQLLFRIDPDTYQTAVRDAELLVEQAIQDNAQLDASIAAATAEVARMRAQVADAERELRRLQGLVGEKYVSRSALDQAQARHDVAQAALQSARAALNAVRVQRGSDGDSSLRLRRARNTLANAQLNLHRSDVVAAAPGIVSNMRLVVGAYAQAGAPKLALISTAPNLQADFREKALLHVVRGTRAQVAFDALPGRLFEAEVTSLDAGVVHGQIDPDGRLAAPDQNDRWVRDAERVRVNLHLLDPPPRPLMTGARATVQLHPQAQGFRRWLGNVQIRLITLLHYVY
ncbi:HlyD family secretion protein [Lysobacter panacisoli]|uniref:HlyD family secretion protein n=1 Tax=Lysobacter panacisoli TaxID=1255263 RepID=A0ABP9LD48_9GAMM|nr:HlyD family secretion protein [Lysobacter panacisoli]